MRKNRCTQILARGSPIKGLGPMVVMPVLVGEGDTGGEGKERESEGELHGGGQE